MRSACTLAASLLTQRVSQSARRIVGLLASDYADEKDEGGGGVEEEEEDGEEEGKAAVFVDFAESVKTRALLSRLTALARLYIASAGVSCVEHGGGGAHSRIEAPEAAVQLTIRKAIEPFAPKLRAPQIPHSPTRTATLAT